MTRKELIAQCRYYKGEDECPIGANRIFWMHERNYVMYGGEPVPDWFDSEFYFKRFGERTYRGIPYGILYRIYTYCSEKGIGYTNSLEEFHKYLDSCIEDAKYYNKLMK